MATITVIEPGSGKTKTITMTVQSAMIMQDLVGEVEYFLTLLTNAKDVIGNTISQQDITGLADGAGGGTNDRHGSAGGGKYANLTTAINDYVAMMVDGIEDQPWTEMSFE